MRALFVLGLVFVLGLMLVEIPGGTARVSAQGLSVAAAPAASEADIATLRERAAAFWAARVSGDAEAQWQLLEPRGKGRMTAGEYGAAPTGGRYLAYQVEDASINGYFGSVKVRLLVQQVLPSPGAKPLPPQTTTVEDGWVRIKGVWYRRWETGQRVSPQEPQR